MATVNASERIPPIMTSVATMAGSTAAAPQPVPSAALHPGPSTSIPLGGMAQQPLHMQSA